jgi:predicted transcriptional regulator
LTQRLSIRFEKVKRNRTQICIDVLKAIKEGYSKPTRIMYRSNLSWHSLKNMLSELETLGLIQKEMKKPRNGTRLRSTYTITEKGMKIVTKANELENELMYASLID